MCSTAAASTPAGATFTATLRAPNGSTSNPLRCNSSEISVNTACCAGESSSTIGISKRWLSTFCAPRCLRTRSNNTRSWATCWSTIHRPSSFTARMNEFRIWPTGLSVTSEARVGSRSVTSMAGAHPLSGIASGPRATGMAAFASTAMPPSNCSRAEPGGMVGGCSVNATPARG